VKTIIAWLALLSGLASGQYLEKTLSLRDTFGWFTGIQSCAYNTRAGVAYVSGDTDFLLVVDGTTNAKLAKVPVPTGILRLCYDSTDNRLFCARPSVDSIAVFDCEANRVVASIPAGHRPGFLCYCDRGNKVYAVNYGDTTITAIDCASNSVVRTITAGAGIDSVSYNRASHTLWFSHGWEDTAFAIDCSLDSVVARVPLGDECLSPSVNPVTGYVYCLKDRSHSILVIDGFSFGVVDSVVVPHHTYALVCDWRNNQLLCFGDSVTVVDCQVNRVTSALLWPELSVDATSYNAAAAQVYVEQTSSWDGPGVIASIDGCTYKLTLMTGLWDQTDIVAAPNGKTYFCGDDDPLLIVDGQTGDFAGALQDEFSASDLYINPIDGKVYTLGNHPVMLVLDSLNLTYTFHDIVDFGPGSLCINTVDNKVYGTNWITDLPSSIIAVSGTTQRVLRRIIAGQDLYALCYNPVDDKVYCGSDQGDVTVVDGSTDSAVARVQIGSGAWALAFAIFQDKVYCGGGGEWLTVIDGAGDTILGEVNLRDEADALHYCPTEGKLYCVVHDTLRVIDCRRDSVLGDIALPGRPGATCFNACQDKMYAVIPGDTMLLAVVDCHTDQLVKTLPVGAGYGQICFDEDYCRLYCTSPGTNRVVMLDGTADAIIGSIEVGSGPTAIVNDPATHRLYVVNSRDPTVSVIRDLRTPVRRAAGVSGRIPTVERGRLLLPPAESGCLLDISGRRVASVHPGLNDVRRLRAGVYFLRLASDEEQEAVKVVLLR